MEYMNEKEVKKKTHFLDDNPLSAPLEPLLSSSKFFYAL